MKKNTLLAAMLLATITTSAQNFYTFTKSTATYTNLSSPISMNGNVVWEYDDFGPITSNFPIYIFGQTFTEFGFEDDNFILIKTLPTGDEFVYAAPISAYTQDRNISGTGNSQSPISYKIEGATGNRILKLELKNAGLEEELYEYGTTNLFLNYQVWFYEADKSMEFHFGANNITDLSMLNDEGLYNSIFLYETIDSENSGAVSGNIATPSYSEYDDMFDVTTNLSAMPTVNTVYRFAINPLSVQDQEKVQFSMFPNPTTNVLNLTFAEEVNKPYSVYDLLGREVLKGNMNSVNQSQINVNTLQSGTYVLRIAGSTQKFVKN